MGRGPPPAGAAARARSGEAAHAGPREGARRCWYLNASSSSDDGCTSPVASSGPELTAGGGQPYPAPITSSAQGSDSDGHVEVLLVGHMEVLLSDSSPSGGAVDVTAEYPPRRAGGQWLPGVT
eukprot:CAMPEP_0182877888 /NCGR_PEP_ID=MMETSP0034_2-20130328/15031_1 /TAXON_ID=156128 /ORGANISM="Nephroselmis pyriformis, Strain CCMP717" /LENGTH=122 /DNA_ID=CAMNT_0025010753 /DNA_START=49 /DNA_END=413 /DNA_ORIENTATION=-